MGHAAGKGGGGRDPGVVVVSVPTVVSPAASGSHIVPDALAPISVDCERDEVCYVEPGVWMLHA